MKSVFGVWSIVLVLCLSATGLSIRYIALHSIPLSESLVVRGFVCLAMVVGWARYRSLSLRPKFVKTQIVRAAIAGLALSFFSMSYNWLSASSVAMLSNIDVPMLVILGSLVGQASSLKTKLLSLLSIVLLVIYGSHVQHEPQWVLGLATLGLGLFLLCFGYYFIKKSMNEENRAITVLTPAVAIIVYGGLQKFTEVSSLGTWDLTILMVTVISAVGMFGAYYATMKLYALTDIAMAEFPTLLSSLAIQPLEYLLFNEPLMPSQFFLSFLFVGCTYLILNSEKSNVEAVHAS